MKVIYDMQKITNDFKISIANSGLRYSDIASMIGISTSAISRFATGKTKYPSKDHIDSILRFMNKTRDEYAINSQAFICDVDSIDIDSVTIEELDEMIDKLVAIRKEKLTSRLVEIRNEESYILAMLNKEVER